MYINNNIQYNLRDDISIFYEGEFESIFIETLEAKGKGTVVGEIYRIPNTNMKISLESFESIISQIDGHSSTIIGTDQNIDFLHTMHDGQTEELLNVYLASAIIPTITKPTRITHTTATLIDNLLVKYQPGTTIYSGIIISDISDQICLYFVSLNITTSDLNL